MKKFLWFLTYLILTPSVAFAVDTDLTIRIIPSATPSPHTVVLGMAEDAYQGDAQYRITLDNVQVLTGFITVLKSSSNSQDVTVNVPNGTHTIGVTLTNDLYGGSPSTDRNLYVNYAKYDGVLIDGATANILSSTDQFVQVVPPPPPGSVDVPAAASAAGFTTVALNSDFSQPQPSGWFGCLSSGAGKTWYQGREGGDFGAQVSCNANLSSGRITLAQDSGVQVLKMSFQPGDIVDNGSQRVHYTTIQTVDDSVGPPNCCIHGVAFPSNYYMEGTYRIVNTPAVPKLYMGGIYYGFWQAGEGTPAGNRFSTLEVDHSEQHSEWPELNSWAVINWKTNVGGGYFPYFDVINGLDVTAYHTFAVRSITSGNSVTVCSYLDNAQRGCNTFALDTGQATERKFPILFVGYQCYYFPSVSSNCINKPIAQIYNCGGKFCVRSATKIEEQNFWPVQMNISGVTGASNINGSWPATAIGWSNGATDWELGGSTFNGSPTGGTINPATQVDLLVKKVRVFSCASWQTTNC